MANQTTSVDELAQAKQVSALYRNFSSSTFQNNPKADAQITNLEVDIENARLQLHHLKQRGKQQRSLHLQSLDALETRRLSLQEILRRLDQEFNDRNVYEYGDVLAEVFGERKIYAHRAIGLEALLCQFMHQMLAKQHQLKIVKAAGKELSTLYKSQLHKLKDAVHSYEALAIQTEASRFFLQALYEDVFASQHKLLQRLLDIEQGGTGRLPSDDTNEETKSHQDAASLSMLQDKTKSLLSSPLQKSKPKLRSDISPWQDEKANSAEKKQQDRETALDILAATQSDDDGDEDELLPAQAQAAPLSPSVNRQLVNQLRSVDLVEDNDGGDMHLVRKQKSQKVLQVQAELEHEAQHASMVHPSLDSKQQHRADVLKTARERRRQIEQKRLSGKVGSLSSSTPSNHTTKNKNNYSTPPPKEAFYDEDDHETQHNHDVRSRMRQLEAMAQKSAEKHGNYYSSDDN